MALKKSDIPTCLAPGCTKKLKKVHQVAKVCSVKCQEKLQKYYEKHRSAKVKFSPEHRAQAKSFRAFVKQRKEQENAFYEVKNDLPELVKAKLIATIYQLPAGVILTEVKKLFSPTEHVRFIDTLVAAAQSLVLKQRIKDIRAAKGGSR